MPLDTILLILAAVLFFYFLMIRPMRKQVAAQQELRNSLEVGSRVQLSSGMLATIKHLGDRQVIVELAPGVEVTVLKQAIGAIVRAEDEEFEYEDEVPVLEDEPVLEGEGIEGTEQYGTEQNGTEQNKGY
ncbi:preprotein translocase subunit YajC [Aestuariimicrobium sp. Y1814]|uniref:preprotein translocase subunit YajC n=1 Tax=Aestuariimicrobium sp. Y1814 TaxID=3418742 RepID=UPI003DA76305